MTHLENQLWLWLEDCEARKPSDLVEARGLGDRVVRVLQYEVREGRETSEA